MVGTWALSLLLELLFLFILDIIDVHLVSLPTGPWVHTLLYCICISFMQKVHCTWLKDCSLIDIIWQYLMLGLLEYCILPGFVHMFTGWKVKYFLNKITSIFHDYFYVFTNIATGAITFSECLCIRACVDFEHKYLWISGMDGDIDKR